MIMMFMVLGGLPNNSWFANYCCCLRYEFWVFLLGYCWKLIIMGFYMIAFAPYALFRDMFGCFFKTDEEAVKSAAEDFINKTDKTFFEELQLLLCPIGFTAAQGAKKGCNTFMDLVKSFDWSNIVYLSQQFIHFFSVVCYVILQKVDGTFDGYNVHFAVVTGVAILLFCSIWTQLSMLMAGFATREDIDSSPHFIRWSLMLILMYDSSFYAVDFDLAWKKDGGLVSPFTSETTSSRRFLVDDFPAELMASDIDFSAQRRYLTQTMTTVAFGTATGTATGSSTGNTGTSTGNTGTAVDCGPTDDATMIKGDTCLGSCHSCQDAQDWTCLQEFDPCQDPSSQNSLSSDDYYRDVFNCDTACDNYSGNSNKKRTILGINEKGFAWLTRIFGGIKILLFLKNFAKNFNNIEELEKMQEKGRDNSKDQAKGGLKGLVSQYVSVPM